MGAEERKVLFQYKDSRWPVVLQSDDISITQKVKEHYSLNSLDGTIIFQKYSETWSEWVDITEDEISDKDKVNIIVLKNPINEGPQNSQGSLKADDSLNIKNQVTATDISSQPTQKARQTTLLVKKGSVAIGPVLEIETSKDDSKVVVEMCVDEIKEKSVIYSNSSQGYHNKMNEASFELCLNNPALCNNKQQLIDMWRQKLDKEGYNYSKKRSRSKLFGSESREMSNESKKKKMSADIRAKRVKELTADITSLEDRMKLLQKQRVRDEQLKQYLRASAMEEEIAKIRTEKRKKEEELMLIKKKQAKASWYKEKHFSNSSCSSTSSDDKSKSRPLSTFWAKKDEASVVNLQETNESTTSASENQPSSDVQSTPHVQPSPGSSSSEAMQDVDNDKSDFL